MLRVPSKVPNLFPSLRWTPHRGNHVAFQLWFNIPKSPLTRFISQRGGWEIWEGEGLSPRASKSQDDRLYSCPHHGFLR